MNRVEFHCHTGFSKEDATASVRDIVDFAIDQGMTSVAFTDHGNVSAYPEIQQYCETKEGFKPIYGMEGYVVNDIDLLGKNLSGSLYEKIDTDVVVIDIETTGFSPLAEEIIELSAVKIINGNISDTYHSYIKPSMPISGKVHNLTGIDNFLVQDAEKIDAVLPKFLEFINDHIIVARNAAFILNFIEENAFRLGIPFDYRSMDTKVLSDFLCLESCGHENGVTFEKNESDMTSCDSERCDVLNEAKMYLEIVENLKERGIKTIGEVIGLIDSSDEVICKCPTFQISILAKNMKGICSLYRLITNSNIKYYNLVPRIRLSKLLADRENLLIGSACEAGIIGRAVRAAKSTKIIEELATVFDFLEVQPANELLWMISDDYEDSINSEDDIRIYTNRIIKLGEKLNKLVLATSDVHYLRPENAISRCVLREDLCFNNPTIVDNLYFRTTKEMLDEFSYLGEEKAYEIVVENTNKLADQIEYIKPLEHKKVTYNREGDYEKLESLCYKGLKRIYGEQVTIENVSVEVRARLEKELSVIKKNENAYYYLWFYELIHDSNLNPAQYNLRGMSASLFVNYLLEISHVNPLDGEVPLYSEFFQGLREDKHPDIDMNFDSGVWYELLEKSKKLSGIKTAYRAGTIATISEYKSSQMHEWYEERYYKLTDEQKTMVMDNLSSTVRYRGTHPGGMIMIPEGVDEVMYAPLDMNEERSEISLQFDYHCVDHIFDKVDILKHDNCTLNARLYEITGYYPTDEDIRSDEILSLITNCEGLGIPQGKNYGMKSGLLAIPGFVNEFMLMLVDALQPKTYKDLVKIEAIGHGTNTWIKNGEVLLAEGKAALADLISTREDVFETMLAHGMDKDTSFAIAEDVRKGKKHSGKMKPELREEMLKAKVPDWYIESCEKIKYLFPRAHAAENIQMELRTLYYKLHYPEVFYKLFFEMYGTDKFKEYYAMGKDGFSAMNYYLMTDKTATLKDLYFHKVWNECRLRNAFGN